MLESGTLESRQSSAPYSLTVAMNLWDPSRAFTSRLSLQAEGIMRPTKCAFHLFRTVIDSCGYCPAGIYGWQ